MFNKFLASAIAIALASVSPAFALSEKDAPVKKEEVKKEEVKKEEVKKEEVKKEEVKVKKSSESSLPVNNTGNANTAPRS